MKTILAILNVVLPVISGLGGAFIVGYYTRKSQQDLQEKDINRENNREMRKESIETVQVYNEIMKIDGDYLILTYNGGFDVKFEDEIYREKIRPFIYSKFHLIHSDVAEVVKEIDRVLKDCYFYEEITEDEHEELAKYYKELIKTIDAHIAEYRETRKFV